MIGVAVATLLLGLAQAGGDDGSLSLADLAAYRAALEVKEGGSASVTFRDLWDHPDRHAGRLVRVEGKLARRFRQDPLGEFPALVEAWIVTPQGDPICLVYPDVAVRPDPGVGSSVRFSGTFLRKIRYRGGDEPRLAPLLVGPSSPVPETPSTQALDWPGSTIDWTVGLGGSALILLVLARRHLGRPMPRPRVIDPHPRVIDPHPRFVDGPGGADTLGSGS